jgi:hypothetical protein
MQCGAVLGSQGLSARSENSPPWHSPICMRRAAPRRRLASSPIGAPCTGIPRGNCAPVAVSTPAAWRDPGVPPPAGEDGCYFAAHKVVLEPTSPITGGGGNGPNEIGSGGQPSESGQSGVGSGETGGGDGGKTRGADSGQSASQLTASPGPRIDFQNHAGEDRVIDLGNSLIVNTQHRDFIARNPGKSGAIRLDARLLGYVSLVIAPPCVHRLFERRGKVPTALEAGANIIDLSTKLETELIGTVLGQQIEVTR